MTFPKQAPLQPGEGLVPDQSTPGNPPNLLALLRSMLLIREFERCLMKLPRPGFQLLSAGEEAVAVGVCAALEPGDQLLSSGRAIGPALARGVKPAAVMAELLGKASGPCRGRGGRGHLAQPNTGLFGAHAVVGGNLTVAAGVALAAQLQGQRRLVVCLFGDGACGAGSLHETLNLAALWRLPLLLVCNNNQYSVSTPVRAALAPRQLSDLALPFGIPGQTVDGMDVEQVRDHVLTLAERARAGVGPSFLECVSYRFASHSTSSRESRPEEEIRHWRARCPIRLLTERLTRAGLLEEPTRARLQQEVEQEAAEAARTAWEAADPDPSEGLEDDC